ncbi:MAG: CocE/NonD family hydrolase [Lysobacterales bacterium]
MKNKTVWSMVMCMALWACTLPPVSAHDPWAIQNIIVERDQAARMRDGVALYADVYRPAEPGTYPALLIRTPYNKALEAVSFIPVAVRRGYVVVVQDVRGEFKSEGHFLPYTQEVDDGYDTIEWVAALPYVNGKVGTFGLSYPGAVQWMTAPSRPPHLVAMVPAMTFANSRHFVYDGGIFVSPILNWLLGRQAKERRERGLPFTTPGELQDAWTHNAGKWLMTLPLRDLAIMQDFPYWAEWIDHQDDGPYWAPYDIEAQHNRVEVPVLNLTGWNDDSYGQPGAIRNYMGMTKNGATERARRGQRLLIGPWTHGVESTGRTSFRGRDYGPSAAIDYNQTLLQFFDYWLRGVDNGFSTQPPIRIFVMGDNKWRFENEWPPARTEYEKLFLRSDNRLTRDAPAEDGLDQFVYDPRNAVRLPAQVTYETEPGSWRMVTARRDVLTYTTPPLDRDIEITGQIIGKIWVSSTAPDTDFTLRLLDLAPDGAPSDFTAAFGRLRARYRSTEHESAPQPLPRNQATELTISMGYTSNVIKAGHRLQVIVMGSVYPYVHPNTWEPFTTWSQAVPATQTIYHDANHPSHVILPLIPR